MAGPGLLKSAYLTRMLDNEIDTGNITQITLDRLTLAHLYTGS